MGLRLDMEIPGSTNKSTKYLLEYLVGEVYSIRIQYRGDFEKEYFSKDHHDGSCFLNYSKYGYIYFWKRDLEKILDMKYVESQFKEKKRAGALCFCIKQISFFFLMYAEIQNCIELQRSTWVHYYRAGIIDGRREWTT